MSTIKSSTTTTTAYQVSADTTGTLVIQTGSTPTTAVTVGTDQSVTFAQAANLPNTFGFKNRIINGAMVIDQRNAGASVTQTTANLYGVDRFQAVGSVTSKFTFQQSSTAPTGFINSTLITSSAATSVGASDFYIYGQLIEGLNIADLGWGTANATTVTLSFWVRSSLTGTFGGSIQNSDNTRNYPFSYTISAANTWEQKTVTIAGDTSGTWLTTNGTGMKVRWSMGAGATVSGTAGAWSGTLYYSATGATSVVGTNGATFYITGVQLEKGSTATSFDYRPYGTELALCQRYYEEIGRGVSSSLAMHAYGVSGQTVATWYPFAVSKRAAPTMTVVGTFLANSCGQPTLDATTISGFRRYQVASATAITQSETTSSAQYFTATAEL